MMQFQIAESLSDLDGDEFDRLDPGCGPVGSHSRLVQLERDPRWSTDYLCAREGGMLLAAAPIYRLKRGGWPDSSYDPVAWGLDPVAPPDEVTVVGGRSGLLSSLHVSPAIRGTRRHIRLIEELLTRESRSALLLPYLTGSEMALWDSVLGSRLPRRALGADARFDGQLAAETSAGKVGQTIRKDRQMADLYGVESSVTTWSAVRSHAAQLIAHDNRAKGLPDAEQIVDFRVRQWEACEDVSVVVLTARAQGEYGVVVCVAWRDWIDLQEAGITGTRSNLRQTLYAQMLYHLPLQHARQRGGIRHVRAGLKAERAKEVRGASFVPLAGGFASFSSRHISGSPS